MISNRFSKIDYKLFCLTVNNKFIIINIGLHLESDGLSLKGLSSNPDHLSHSVLHPVHSLPDHHLRDWPELPPDCVMQVLQADWQWLVHCHLQIAPQEAVTKIYIR